MEEKVFQLSLPYLPFLPNVFLQWCHNVSFFCGVNSDSRLIELHGTWQWHWLCKMFSGVLYDEMKLGAGFINFYSCLHLRHQQLPGVSSGWSMDYAGYFKAKSFHSRHRSLGVRFPQRSALGLMEIPHVQTQYLQSELPHSTHWLPPSCWLPCPASHRMRKKYTKQHTLYLTSLIFCPFIPAL